MTRKLRQTFSPEFKREAVKLLKSSGKEAAQLARELGVRRNQSRVEGTPISQELSTGHRNL